MCTFLLQNVVLWDMGLVHHGICEMGVSLQLPLRWHSQTLFKHRANISSSIFCEARTLILYKEYQFRFMLVKDYYFCLMDFFSPTIMILGVEIFCPQHFQPKQNVCPFCRLSNEFSWEEGVCIWIIISLFKVFSHVECSVRQKHTVGLAFW